MRISTSVFIDELRHSIILNKCLKLLRRNLCGFTNFAAIIQSHKIRWQGKTHHVTNEEIFIQNCQIWGSFKIFKCRSDDFTYLAIKRRTTLFFITISCKTNFFNFHRSFCHFFVRTILAFLFLLWKGWNI